MNIDTVQEYKLEIKGKERIFRLDFGALIKFNKKYENSMEIFNDFLKGTNEYDCIIKILSCSSKDEEIEDDFLKKNLSFDFPTIKILDLISKNMIQGSLILDEKETEQEESNEKKQETSQEN
jgi:hypothetical protein